MHPARRAKTTQEMHQQYIRHASPASRIGFGTFARIITLLKEGKLDKTEIAQLTKETENRVRKISERFGFETGSEAARNRSRALRTENRMPTEARAYMEFRKTMSLKGAAAKAGIDDQAAARIDAATLTGRQRAQRKAALVSAAQTSSARPHIRKLLAVRNPDRTFRFPQSIIATAADVSIMAVKNANKVKPPIRTVEEATDARAVFNRINKNPKEREKLLREAKMHFDSLKSRANIQEKLLKLSATERATLRNIILSHETLKMPRMRGDSQEDVRYIANSPERFLNREKVIKALIDTPTFEITHASLFRHVPDNQALNTTLKELGVSQGIGLVIQVNKSGNVRLNPDVVLLLQKA